MWNIAEQVQAAIVALHVSATRLPPEYAQLIRDRMLAQYGSCQDGRYLWECLAEVVSVQDPEAWKWIGAYRGDSPSVMFFNPDDELVMFEFAHNRDVVGALSECTGFEFYITNRENDFLLCFNHHDFLIAAGDARSWLAERVVAHTSTSI